MWTPMYIENNNLLWLFFVTDIDCVLCQVGIKAEEKFDELNIPIEYN
jgi:hypothetical protein